MLARVFRRSLVTWLCLAAMATHGNAADGTAGRPLPIDTAVDASIPIPPAATHHCGREIAQTMHFTGAPWLVRESRQREEDCRLMLDALDVRPGQTICDMGCGNGFYTLELARRVGPKGLVYAVDIQPEMLRMLAEAAGREGLTNIRPVLGTAIDRGCRPPRSTSACAWTCITSSPILTRCLPTSARASPMEAGSRWSSFAARIRPFRSSPCTR